MKLIALLSVAATCSLLSLTPANATAVGSNQTYTFTDACAANDCTGSGVATLKAKNYVEGSRLHYFNLVAFTYSSKLLPLVDIMPDPNGVFSLTGSISSAPGDYNVAASSFATGSATYAFNSSTDGTWSVRQNNVDRDNGTQGVWNAAGAVSAAPEPGTQILMLGEVGAVGAALRLAIARRRENEAWEAGAQTYFCNALW